MSSSEEHHHKHTSTREEDQSTDTYREARPASTQLYSQSSPDVSQSPTIGGNRRDD